MLQRDVDNIMLPSTIIMCQLNTLPVEIDPQSGSQRRARSWWEVPWKSWSWWPWRSWSWWSHVGQQGRSWTSSPSPPSKPLGQIEICSAAAARQSSLPWSSSSRWCHCLYSSSVGTTPPPSWIGGPTAAWLEAWTRWDGKLWEDPGGGPVQSHCLLPRVALQTQTVKNCPGGNWYLNRWRQSSLCPSTGENHRSPNLCLCRRKRVGPAWLASHWEWQPLNRSPRSWPRHSRCPSTPGPEVQVQVHRVYGRPHNYWSCVKRVLCQESFMCTIKAKPWC